MLIGLGAGTGLVLHPALVLVAGQRLVGDQRDGRILRDVASSCRPMGLDLSDTGSPDYAFTMLITVAVTTVVWLGGHLPDRP